MIEHPGRSEQHHAGEAVRASATCHCRFSTPERQPADRTSGIKAAVTVFLHSDGGPFSGKRLPHNGRPPRKNASAAAQRALCTCAEQAQAVAASLGARSGELWGMTDLTRPMKITFGEMRASGI